MIIDFLTFLPCIELCETVVSGWPIEMETEMMRCYGTTYGLRKNSTRSVRLEFLFGKTYEMIDIPSTISQGDVLCCYDITKLCDWIPCPVIPPKPTIPTLPKITYFKIIFFFRGAVKVTVGLQKAQYWIFEVANITETVTDICTKEHAVKLTIEIPDVSFMRFNSNFGTIVDKVNSRAMQL